MRVQKTELMSTAKKGFRGLTLNCNNLKKTFFTFVFLTLFAGTSFARAIQEDIQAGQAGIDTSQERAILGYAIGMSFGLEFFRDSGLEFDYAAFTRGLRSAMEGEDLLFSEEEAYDIMDAAFQSARQREQEAVRLAESLFLNQNALRDEVYVTESGLQYEIVEQGTGPSPDSFDLVRVRYEGFLINGEIFDGNMDSEEGDEIPLYMVIPGWAEGVSLMNVGSVYRLYIPSDLAYGSRGAGQLIPPYSTLIFTVELLEIISLGDDDYDNGYED